jgi:hypothetical protein
MRVPVDATRKATDDDDPCGSELASERTPCAPYGEHARARTTASS